MIGLSQGSRTERNREGMNTWNSEFILSSRNRCGSRVLGISKWENKLKETKLELGEESKWVRGRSDLGGGK